MTIIFHRTRSLIVNCPLSILPDLYAPCRVEVRVPVVYLVDNVFGEFLEGAAGEGVRVKCDRLAAVAAFADALHDGDLSQQGDMQLFRQSLAALFAEEVIAVRRQFGGRKPGHVFNQTQDGDVHLLACEHADAFAGVGEGHLLRRGHHDGACDGQRLYHGQVDVAGSRRQVDEEVVQIAPVGVANELLQRINRPSWRRR